MTTAISAVKRIAPHLSRVSIRRQRGVATLLVILMVGVGLVSVSLGTLHSVRSAQERQLVAHAQVNAQAAVWATVDVVRQYLKTLTPQQLAGLTQNSTCSISGNDALVQSVST